MWLEEEHQQPRQMAERLEWEGRNQEKTRHEAEEQLEAEGDAKPAPEEAKHKHSF